MDHTPTLESRVCFLRNGVPPTPPTNCLLQPQYPPQCIYSQAQSSGREAVSPRPMKHPRGWRCAKDKLTPHVILAKNHSSHRSFTSQVGQPLPHTPWNVCVAERHEQRRGSRAPGTLSLPGSSWPTPRRLPGNSTQRQDPYFLSQTDGGLKSILSFKQSFLPLSQHPSPPRARGPTSPTLRRAAACSVTAASCTVLPGKARRQHLLPGRWRPDARENARL